MRRLRSRATAALLCCAPLVLAACGVAIYDTTSRVLILEPVERIVFDSDSGAIEIYAFDRTAINLFFYLTGFETSIADVGHSLEGDQLRAFILCDGDQLCSADFYAEIPLSTAVEIRADAGDVKLTGVEAAVAAKVGTGAVDGVGLASPDFDLEVVEGAVTLAWVSPPTALKISVTTGDVTLTLPAGAYRCDFKTQGGAVESQGIDCDPTAARSVTISVQTGDIHLQGTTP